MGLVVMKRIKDLFRSLLHSHPKVLIFTYCNKSSSGKYSQLITHGLFILSCPLVCIPNTKPYKCNVIQVCIQLSFSSLLSYPSYICYSSLDQVLGIFSVLLKISPQSQSFYSQQIHIHLGKISDYLHPNNKNDWLKRRVQSPRDVLQMPSHGLEHLT